MASPARNRPPEAKRIVLSVPPRETACLHAILDGYDDLAVLRTIFPGEGLIEARVSPGSEREFSELLAALRAEGLSLEVKEDGDGAGREPDETGGEPPGGLRGR